MDTLEKTTNNNNNMTRRKTISDALITDDAIVSIVNMVFSKVDNPNNITQKDVVKLLLKTKLSNKTMARVVNLILPNSKATEGSIASLVKYIRNQDIDMDALLSEIEKDIMADD